jgi:signal transduction histidine kinase
MRLSVHMGDMMLDAPKDFAMAPAIKSDGVASAHDVELVATGSPDGSTEEETQRKARQLLEANEHLVLTVLSSQQEKLVAEHIQRAQKQFIALMAHELRNPLAPLRSGLELLEAAPANVELVQEVRSIMARQVDHLTRMVDDLLTGACVTDDSLVLQRKRVCLGDVIAHSVQTTQSLVRAGGHSLEVATPAEPVYVDADEVRLAQVFTNLLNNACKYTPTPGSITLSVIPQMGEVIVAVKDSGVGLKREDLERVFDLFVRVGASSWRPQGMGIGLALVRSLVEMHGGSVTASSEGPGKGCTFTVRLPIASPDPSHMG